MSSFIPICTICTICTIEEDATNRHWSGRITLNKDHLALTNHLTLTITTGKEAQILKIENCLWLILVNTLRI